VLQHFARRDPYAFPGQARLAAILSVTERTVRSYLRELVAAGLIRIEQRGLHQTNRYWLIGAPDDPPLVRDPPGDGIGAADHGQHAPDDRGSPR
jgi:hypothetical protein